MKPAVRCLALIVALACTAHAQDADPLAPLRHGTLVIWVVKPPSERKLDNHVPQYRTAQPGYHESTTGTLGQSAGTFGQTAGSYGVDSGSTKISAPSSPTAQNARMPGDDTPARSGYREQTSGNYGQTSGNFGQAAGSTGQTLSNFGDSLTTIGHPKETTPPPFTIATRPPYSSLERDLNHTFPQLTLQISDVYPVDFPTYLAAAVGTPSYPDVLIGDFMTNDWPKLQAHFAVPMIRRAEFQPDGIAVHPDWYQDYALMVGAQHLETARAFALWMNREEWCQGCGLEPPAPSLKEEESKAASVAVSAMQNLLNGESVGELADPAMAIFSPLSAKYLLATSDGRIPTEGVHTEVLESFVNGALAVVRLRIVVSSDEEFGVVRPVFVLRRNGTGWRVLQVSLNLQWPEAHRVSSLLMSTSPPQREERKAGVMGVTLTAPDEDSSVQRVAAWLAERRRRGLAGRRVVALLWHRWRRHASLLRPG
jgi:hypothetical protein